MKPHLSTIIIFCIGLSCFLGIGGGIIYELREANRTLNRMKSDLSGIGLDLSAVHSEGLGAMKSAVATETYLSLMVKDVSSIQTDVASIESNAEGIAKDAGFIKFDAETIAKDVGSIKIDAASIVKDVDSIEILGVSIKK